MSRFTRRPEIDRRRRRRAKYLKLKTKLAKAKDQREIEKIVLKFKKIQPQYPVQLLTKT